MSITSTDRQPVAARGTQALPRDAEKHARALVEKLGGLWRGSRGQCRCPAHDDDTPSLSVRLGDTAILYHCFAGCAVSDILRALERLRLHDRELLSMPAARPRRDLSELARRLWRSSDRLAGSPAERYLNARGITVLSPTLRYNARTVIGTGSSKRILPAMIAAVQNDLGLVAVQRTFLDLQEITHKPLVTSKVALGAMGGGAIRLAPASHVLGLAEGVEDALTAFEWFGTPTWALGGIERLASIDIPAEVRHVIVYGDRGSAAEAGLERARAHLTSDGRTLEVRTPDDHADWNEAWRAASSGILKPLSDI